MLRSMDARSILFTGVGKLGEWGRVPQQVPGMEPLWESGGFQIMQNNSSRPTERFSGTTNAQKHFTIFPEGGGKCFLLPMPAGAC